MELPLWDIETDYLLIDEIRFSLIWGLFIQF